MVAAVGEGETRLAVKDNQLEDGVCLEDFVKKRVHSSVGFLRWMVEEEVGWKLRVMLFLGSSAGCLIGVIEELKSINVAVEFI